MAALSAATGRSRAPSAAGVRVRCPAKINLGFWIAGRRPDGYHEVDTILQTITLEDELTLVPATEEGIRLEMRGRAIQGPGPNLVERAWDLLRAEGLVTNLGVHARLTKRIPVGAGLGGGSSDAAGLLAGASRLFDLELSIDDLRALGARLGADVPFLLRGGTARGTGRGDQVRQLCPIPPVWTVLASPPFGISTTWAYGQVRKRLTHLGTAGNVLETAIAAGRLPDVAAAMRNVFEDVVLPEYPVLDALKRAMESRGAIKAQLTGSGSSLFGFVCTHDEALAIAKGIAGTGAEVRVVRTLERGVAVAPLASSQARGRTGLA
ncbi:MAG TPA: 4-(cytidine 5'-diphospho)-2-C-methyl-D-erythritol kinase [Candidatus Eisenbacteria bacterium]|nr:4-(cytidine 5'-diphospho)-2-C-methyl-D-erythritol kinase [Candidatus Eisenbacteria bacterium]